MRATHILVLLLALGATVRPASAEAPTGKDIENVLMRFIQDLSGSLQSGNTKRRLLSVGKPLQSLQEFMSGILGSKWQDLMPASWSSESFDWGKLGEFDYTSNLGDFVDSHDLKNLTDISSMKELHDSYTAVEDNFCTPEEFSLSAKVPASCTGPSVTIALVPKVCILEAATKQVVCDPAKLVLTKAPGSCTHKYHSASTWTGKSCKISGGAGFSDSVTVGGGEKLVPLAQFDFEYTAKK